jgi:hypothetical protein
MSAWVYIKSEPYLWTVGHYSPSGEWRAESDHDNPQEAAARVHHLNGGTQLNALVSYVDDPGNWSALDGRREHLLDLLRRAGAVA